MNSIKLSYLVDSNDVNDDPSRNECERIDDDIDIVDEFFNWETDNDDDIDIPF